MKGLRKIWAVVVMVATICVSPALFMGVADATEPLPGDSGEPVSTVPVESSSGVDWSEVMLWAAVGVLAVAVLAATLVTIRRYQHNHHIAHPA